jgi:His-Xaa-Ser system radical SAM maturase HxsC
MGTSMITLAGRAATSNWVELSNDIWKVIGWADEPGKVVAVAAAGEPTALGGPIYISDMDGAAGPGPTVHVPSALKHIGPGDILSLSPDGHRISVVWKASATHNSILLTERCDNYCIMCSQPPKERDDSYLYGRAKKIVDALPDGALSIALTGGEPTVEADHFLELLRHIAMTAPDISIHILSNGRKFADRAFTEQYASIGLRDAMVGIPLYSSESSVHDFVVQANGAFNETVRGILALGAAGALVELRIVVQQATVPVLSEIATYIARNLPFVAQVALMGLEMTGLARPNSSIVWIDPEDYRAELTEAHRILASAGVKTRIYNHPLCVIDKELWPSAVQSISDWKNNFPDLCAPCAVRDHCAGVFSTSHGRVSAHLKPVLEPVGA